jgi:copper oxidase (laccase) domain-containing protein
MKEGFVIKLQKKAGSTELSTQKEERFSSKRRDRLIEKIAKKQGKKNKRFSFAETDALLTEKKNNMCLLSNASSFLIFSVTNV